MKSGDRRRAQLLDAAIALGVARGAAALSVQSMAKAAGVSKALVLYHLHDRAGVVQAIAAEIAARNARRLEAAASAGGDVLDRWRALARDEVRRGELTLLGALRADGALGASAADGTRGRERAAEQFASALLESLGLTRRLPAALIARVLLRQLDGLVSAYHVPSAQATADEDRAAREQRAADLEDELDAFALALLGLGE